MGFKTGKDNAYAKLAARLREAEAALVYERSTRPMLKLFADRLGQAMLTQLAMTPYQDWPQFAKNIFAWVETEAPTTAWVYKDALPKGK